jgi:hypothetical protein
LAVEPIITPMSRAQRTAFGNSDLAASEVEGSGERGGQIGPETAFTHSRHVFLVDAFWVSCFVLDHV